MELVDRTAFTRLYATVTGLLLSLGGLAGFAVGSEFTEPTLTEDLLGFYPVNGWANSLHLLTGLLALSLARSGSPIWALLGGLFYSGLAIWGILAPDGQLLAGLLPATRSINVVNLLIGVSGLAAFLAARAHGLDLSGAARRRRIRRARKRRRRAARSGT